MQRSRNEDAVVSVRELPTRPFVVPILAAGERSWSQGEVGILLRHRLTLHVSVLVMLAGVLIGARALPGAGLSASSEALDSISAVTPPAIMAHVIPDTAGHTDASYVVRKGDSLSTIASQVGVPEEAILAYNKLTSSDALAVGMTLEIPDLNKIDLAALRIDNAPAPPAQPAAPAAEPQKPAPDIATHVIVQGDTLFSLAASHGISVETLREANNLSATSLLSLGHKLLVPPVNGTIITTGPGDTVNGLAEKYSVPAADLLSVNKLSGQTQSLVPGSLLVIPTGPQTARTEPAPPSTAQPVATDAQAPAKAAEPAAPAKPATMPAVTGGFIWPAPGIITTYFSGWHNGIDIANSLGTPVRAAQAGVVVFSGWDNTGYGYMVRIDHGNGLETLYGHSSKLLVRVGQAVTKGEVIMLMGSTGRSTGPHVHFGVFQGRGYNALNPLRYLP